MIDLAKQMALKSVSKFRLGAVLVKRGRVISTGYNQMRKSHPLMQKYADSKEFLLGLHAEIHACIGVPASDLRDAELWVCRLHKNDSMAMAKPCKVCTKFIVDVGIRRVWYTTQDGAIESVTL